jgi:hypothetical protein
VSPSITLVTAPRASSPHVVVVRNVVVVATGEDIVVVEAMVSREEVEVVEVARVDEVGVEDVATLPSLAVQAGGTKQTATKPISSQPLRKVMLAPNRRFLSRGTLEHRGWRHRPCYLPRQIAPVAKECCRWPYEQTVRARPNDAGSSLAVWETIERVSPLGGRGLGTILVPTEAQGACARLSQTRPHSR